MARFLYFAWVREKIGTASESLELPAEVTCVSDMLSHLRQRGAQYDSALSDPNLQVAINQTYAQPESGVSNGDEIAIFPPVSGG
ncbi:MAG: molybdopterin converting factor subunit 1 [Magnetococcales bacterium]|nr:molybdopterin converting factor subunit 1 [Magnetococcales bacterium]